MTGSHQPPQPWASGKWLTYVPQLLSVREQHANNLPDCVCVYHGIRTFRGFSRVVPLACSFPILSSQSLHQGRSLDYQNHGRSHDDRFHPFEVRVTLVEFSD